MGYAGGTSPDPSYYKIGDHAECTQVVYDPAVLSYERLLERFWEWHNPFRKPYARQYMSAVLYHDKSQRGVVEQDLARMRDGSRRPHTEVQPYRGFTWAEDYHQKYYLRRDRVASAALKALFPIYEDFVNATAVMRVNAILGGYLRPDPEELQGLGLPPTLVESLHRPKSSVWQRVSSLLRT